MDTQTFRSIADLVATVAEQQRQINAIAAQVERMQEYLDRAPIMPQG